MKNHTNILIFIMMAAAILTFGITGQIANDNAYYWEQRWAETNAELNFQTSDFLEAQIYIKELENDLEAQKNATYMAEKKLKELREVYYATNDDYNTLEADYLFLEQDFRDLQAHRLGREVPHSKEYSGQYTYDTGLLKVYTSKLPLDGVFYIAHHEIGHYYWDRVLRESERREFCNEHRKADAFITDYASTQCEEDFAELFAHSVSYKYLDTGYIRFDPLIH